MREIAKAFSEQFLACVSENRAEPVVHHLQMRGKVRLRHPYRGDIDDLQEAFLAGA